VTNTAIRLSGLALAVGVILFGGGIVADVLTQAGWSPGSQQSSQPGDSFRAAGSILIMLALPGVYAYHASKAGWLGLIGYVLFQVGYVFVIVFFLAPLMFNDLFTKDLLANQANTFAFTLGVALSIGFVLTSIAAIRARVYPLWAGILMLGAAIAFVFSFLIADRLPPRAWQISLAVSSLMFGIAWISIGTAMWATTRTE
jgi:hypothetical protein